MRRSIAVGGGVLLLAGVAWLQVAPARARALAEWIPAGSLLYLEAKDFNGLLREWQQSKTKGTWLKSSNYAAFAESNLFQKLNGMYEEYGRAASFVPGLPELVQIAGGESGLALYDAREMQFVYVTKLANAAVTQSALWSARTKFEQRVAAGRTFYLRRDAESGKTVAFAFADDWLVIATREDLMARTLALQAGAGEARLADESWYRDATGASSQAGDVRMVLNLATLVYNTYFRSYWIGRNVAELKGFRSEVADLDRAAAQWTERRVMLRVIEAPGGDLPVDASDGQRRALAQLVGLAPAEAGVYRAWADPDPGAMAGLIEEKLLYPEVRGSGERRFAPDAPDQSPAGGEGDLETRIDTPPLPVGVDSSAGRRAIRDLLQARVVEAAMEVQSSALPAGADFVNMPCVLVFEATEDWDGAAVKRVLSEALGDRVSTGGLGVQWTGGDTAQVDGLAPLQVAARGRLLFLGNDAGMLAAVADKAVGTLATAGDATYVAAFRHVRERANYRRIMRALWSGQSGRAPAFFYANLGSLSDVFEYVNAVEISRAEKGDRVTENVRYEF